MTLTTTQTEAFLNWLEGTHGRLEISNTCSSLQSSGSLLLNGKSVTHQHLQRYAADWLRITSPATGTEIMTVVHSAMLFVMNNVSPELSTR